MANDHPSASFYHGVPTPRRYRNPLTIHYATVYVNTNIPGYDSKFKAALFSIQARNVDYMDNVWMRHDQGWFWAIPWTQEQWNIDIIREEIVSGTYFIRIQTTQPHHWANIVRHLRTMINSRDASWRMNTRMNLCLQIIAGRPTQWGMEAIGAFQLSTIKRRALKPKRQRRGPA